MSDDDVKQSVLKYLTAVFPQLPTPLLLQIIIDTLNESGPVDITNKSFVSQSCVDQLLDLSTSSDESSPVKHLLSYNTPSSTVSTPPDSLYNNQVPHITSSSKVSKPPNSNKVRSARRQIYLSTLSSTVSNPPDSPYNKQVLHTTPTSIVFKPLNSDKVSSHITPTSTVSKSWDTNNQVLQTTPTSTGEFSTAGHKISHIIPSSTVSNPPNTPFNNQVIHTARTSRVSKQPNSEKVTSHITPSSTVSKSQDSNNQVLNTTVSRPSNSDKVSPARHQIPNIIPSSTVSEPPNSNKVRSARRQIYHSTLSSTVSNPPDSPYNKQVLHTTPTSIVFKPLNSDKVRSHITPTSTVSKSWDTNNQVLHTTPTSTGESSTAGHQLPHIIPSSTVSNPPNTPFNNQVIHTTPTSTVSTLPNSDKVSPSKHEIPHMTPSSTVPKHPVIPYTTPTSTVSKPPNCDKVSAARYQIPQTTPSSTSLDLSGSKSPSPAKIKDSDLLLTNSAASKVRSLFEKFRSKSSSSSAKDSDWFLVPQNVESTFDASGVNVTSLTKTPSLNDPIKPECATLEKYNSQNHMKSASTFAFISQDLSVIDLPPNDTHFQIAANTSPQSATADRTTSISTSQRTPAPAGNTPIASANTIPSSSTTNRTVQLASGKSMQSEFQAVSPRVAVNSMTSTKHISNILSIFDPVVNAVDDSDCIPLATSNDVQTLAFSSTSFSFDNEDSPATTSIAFTESAKKQQQLQTPARSSQQISPVASDKNPNDLNLSSSRDVLPIGTEKKKNEISEINTGVLQVLDIFPDADAEWVQNQLQAIKSSNSENFIQEFCNLMSDNPYKHKQNISDVSVENITRPRKCLAKTKHLHGVPSFSTSVTNTSTIPSTSTTEDAFTIKSTTDRWVENRKRKADAAGIQEHDKGHSPAKNIKMERDIVENEMSNPVNRENEISDGCMMICEGCQMFHTLDKLGQCCEGHLLCQKCIEAEVKSFLTNDTKKNQIDCQVRDCPSFLSAGEVKRIMPPIICELINDRLEKENLALINGLQDIVRCPECGFAAELAQEYKEIFCGNTDCMLAFCRYCKKSWNDCSHESCTPLLTSVDKNGTDVCLESYPKYWTEIDSETDKTFISIAVKDDSDEYKFVSKLITKTLSKNIVSITRIQNIKLWEKYALARKHICDDFGFQNLNEQHLFHGTAPNTIEMICQEGFDWRLSGKHGTIYGEGAYFAREAKYSDKYIPISEHGNVIVASNLGVHVPLSGKPITSAASAASAAGQDLQTSPVVVAANYFMLNYGSSSSDHYVNSIQKWSTQTGISNSSASNNSGPSGLVSAKSWLTSTSFPQLQRNKTRIKLLFVARVVCGRSAIGHSRMRRPPVDISDPKKRLYNSVADNINHPTLYCIFDSMQSYPEYVVEYQN